MSGNLQGSINSVFLFPFAASIPLIIDPKISVPVINGSMPGSASPDAPAAKIRLPGVHNLVAARFSMENLGHIRHGARSLHVFVITLLTSCYRLRGVPCDGIL